MHQIAICNVAHGNGYFLFFIIHSFTLQNTMNSFVEEFRYHTPELPSPPSLHNSKMLPRGWSMHVHKLQSLPSRKTTSRSSSSTTSLNIPITIIDPIDELIRDDSSQSNEIAQRIQELEIENENLRQNIKTSTQRWQKTMIVITQLDDVVDKILTFVDAQDIRYQKLHRIKEFLTQIEM